MHKISCILLLLLSLLLLFFLSCKKSPVKILNDISSHNLKVKLIPDEHKIIAIDTLQIEYRENTNTVYFFLHQSLQIEKICVGNQQLTYEIIPSDKFNKNQFLNSVNNTVYLYKVLLPKSLFPQNIQIWYQGVIAGNYLTGGDKNSNGYSAQNDCCIDHNRINLPGQKFWYPSLPDSKASYKLTSLTPAGLPVITSGSLIFHEQRNDSLISIWEQKIPIESINITSVKMDVLNTSFKYNFRTHFNNNYCYYASYVGEKKRIRDFNCTRRFLLL